MRIDHIGMWTSDLEGMKNFYMTYFNAEPGEKYRNTAKSFESYFLKFGDGSRLELMQMPGIQPGLNDADRQNLGFIHLAVSSGGREQVLALTERLRSDGYRVVGEPRTTGDGYFESVVLDPENNRIEITE